MLIHVVIGRNHVLIMCQQIFLSELTADRQLNTPVFTVQVKQKKKKCALILPSHQSIG